MNIFLLNDTGTVPHVGCQAVSDAHARMLAEAGHIVTDRAFLGELRRFAGSDEDDSIDAVLSDDSMRARLEACDAVVVNGEGTLHHGAGVEYFAVLGAAQRLRKATLIVNAVFEAHSGWLSVLSRLDDFCVRDLASLEHATSQGLRCRLVPDSFLAASFDQRAYADLSNKIVVTDWHPARDGDVGNTVRTLIDRLGSDCFYFPMLHGVHAKLWRGAAATWMTADLVVTARHHGIYLAALAGKPFVALPSNTKKVEGLLAAAGVDIAVCTSLSQVQDSVDSVISRLSEFDKLNQWLADQMPLTTFSVLGRAGNQGDEAAVHRALTRLESDIALRGYSLDPKYWGFRNGSGDELMSCG